MDDLQSGKVNQETKYSMIPMISILIPHVNTIPPEIGHLQQLDRLRLARNRLSGNIPSSLGNLTSLTSLYLGQNNLQGSIPSSLGLCENLLELDLSLNNLSGTIPKELVSLSALSIFMNLSHNLLNGSLPEEVGNLKNLGALDVSDNMLSGEIPTSLGSCVSLEFLRMQRNFLSGELPSSLRSLKGIRMLDLSRNNLTGQLPKFLEQFDLQYLNLSFNDFDGEMLLQGVFKNASVVSVQGNSRLCGGVPELQLPPCKFQNSTKGSLALKFKIIISVVFGVLGVTTLLSTVYFCWLRKKGKGPDLSNSENLTLRLSYQSIVAATDGFSSAHLIGEGSFGSVYKGVIDELGTTVAIKVLNLLRRGASKSFAAECEALRNIRHRNLVKILTACSGVDYKGNEFKALIYEFMVNGSLEKWLHPTPITDEVNEAPRSLNLLQRLNIAIDVASALEYLHNDCQPPVVHCDLKPSNILLDEDMTAHVGDFGIARILPEAAMDLSNNVTSSSIGVRGTTGYTAPEYGMGNEVSTYGDVYSYGVLLLEMFTGKRPTNDMFKDSLSLSRFVKAALPMQVLEIADPILVQEVEGETSVNTPHGHRIQECLASIFTIGVACSEEIPRERKGISNVVTELHSIRNKL